MLPIVTVYNSNKPIVAMWRIVKARISVAGCNGGMCI